MIEGVFDAVVESTHCDRHLPMGNCILAHSFEVREEFLIPSLGTAASQPAVTIDSMHKTIRDRTFSIQVFYKFRYFSLIAPTEVHYGSRYREDGNLL